MAKPITKYDGPNTFSSESVKTLASEVTRGFQRAAAAIRTLALGSPRVWPFGHAVRGPAVTGFMPNVCLEVDSTNGNVTIVLGTPDTQDIGSEFGVMRTSALNTITLQPTTGTTLNGVTNSAVLATTRGMYVVVLGPSGYWLRR